MLITKLRSANTAETRQYRKASKALLILIPLFGLTYLIVLYGPHEGIGRKIFDIARAFLLSTQVTHINFLCTTCDLCLFTKKKITSLNKSSSCSSAHEHICYSYKLYSKKFIIDSKVCTRASITTDFQLTLHVLMSLKRNHYSP